MSYESAKQTIALFAGRREATALGSRMPANAAFTYDTILDAAVRAMREAPSAYNAQEARTLTLLGVDHHNYWRLVCERADTKAAERVRIEQDIMPAMGTMLFFVDRAETARLSAATPAYAAMFPSLSDQAVAMSVTAAWMAISSVDPSLGAMRVYYGCPIAEGNAAREPSGLHPGFPAAMAVPAAWLPHSELVFGSVERAASDADVVPDSHRFMLFSDDYVSVKRL